METLSGEPEAALERKLGATSEYDVNHRNFSEGFAPIYSRAETSQPAVRMYFRDEEFVVKSVLETTIDTRTSRPIRVLDIGHGDGRYGRVLYGYRGVEVIGLDLALNMLKHARNGSSAGLIQGAAEALPFRTGSFDLVSMPFGLLSYVKQPRSLAEAYRLIRPGGYFFGSAYNRDGFNILLQPFFLNESVVASIHVDRDTMSVNGTDFACRAFTIRELQRLLRLQGFNVLEIKTHLGLRALDQGIVRILRAKLGSSRSLTDHFTRNRVLDQLERDFCDKTRSGMYITCVARKIGHRKAA